MAEDESETRTRLQRETTLKEASTLFDKHVRSLNKVARKIQVYLSSDSVDIRSVQGFSQQYESIVENISDFFERIVDLSLGSPPEKLEVDFKRIDFESSKFLSDVRVQIQHFRDREVTGQSEVEERVSVDKLNVSQAEQTESITKLCSQLSLGRLPVPEPDVFSGDPLEFTSWFNSFNTLIRSSSIPDAKCILYLNKYLSGDAKECVKGYLLLR